MKKNQVIISHEMMELESEHEAQATEAANRFQQIIPEPALLALDCIPNGNINVINYGNGADSLREIIKIGHSFLGAELAYFESLLNKKSFQTDFPQGEALGLWKKVNHQNYDELIDWSQPFCLKHENGATKIWHPEWRRFGHNRSFSTRSEIIKFIYAANCYWQKFHLPLPSPFTPGGWKMIYRFVFLCKIETRPELLGGLWISRRSFKVYPAKDAIIGLISPSVKHG